MNRHLHRIIFNAARGCRMVVAEVARSSGKAASGATVASSVAATASLAFLGLAIPTQAQIKADASAPGNQRPVILGTANGVPQVNIQTPSAAGVSRNTYSQFDVQSQGAILNNSATSVQTQLGGWIAGNSMVSGGAARVILNEVNSSNPSYLKGYVEVAGSKAEVIIANPSGIQVNGGGFINASTVTLTTGTPVMNSGSLESYRVNGGRIQIEGLGLDTRTSSTTRILARAAEINAGLWANYLKIVTGANQLNAEDPTGEATGRTPVPITPNPAEVKPRFALDVAAIGGMYAGHIYLIGTENGLGVNTKGSLYATAGDIVLQTNGWLTSNAVIQASGNILIKTTGSSDSTNSGSADGAGTQAAHGMLNGGTIYAEGNTTLQADGDISNAGNSAIIAAQGNASVQAGAAGSAGGITNTGTVAAGLQADGSVGNSGNLTLEATGNITNSGKAYAGAALSLNADSLNNQAGAHIIGGAATSITTTHATSNSGQIQSADTTVQAASLSNSGTFYAKGNLSAQINGDISNSSTASMAAQGNAGIQSRAGGISNAGTLAAGVLADGTLGSTGTLNLNAAGNISNSGKAFAGNTLSVSAANLDNTATGQLAATNAHITASNTFTNRGLVDGADTRIDAGALRNTGTGRIYGDALSISAASLSNDAETVTDIASGVATTSAAVIAARQRLDMGVGTLTNGYANGQSALIYSAGDMAIGASLDNNRQATGFAQSISNAGGTLAAMGKLTASAARISNTNPNFAYEIRSAGSTAEREYIASSGQLYTPSQVAWLLKTNWGSAGGGGGFAYGGAQGRFLPAGHTYADTKYQPYYGSGNAFVAGGYQNTVNSDGIAVSVYTPESFSYTTADPIWGIFGITPPAGATPGPRPMPVCNDIGCNNPTPAELAAWDTAAAPWVVLQAKLDTFRSAVDASAITYTTLRDLSRDTPQAVVTRSTPGKISAGADLTLTATGSLLNEQSQIVAGGRLLVSAAAINNQAKLIDTSAARSGTQYTWDSNFDYGCGGKNCVRYSAYRPYSYSDAVPLTLSLNTASSSASQAGVNQGIVQIPAASNSAASGSTGASVIRTTALSTGLATTPGSSLFRPTPNPAAS
ncbi:MAG: filamentous hemagglutinin N-terminal domain-containing protein, partial [Burkholderiales bacterium]|nr:filamentous hemagglutinin N-terminal domain-containing protein [Burkholderiales bacterium]